MQNLRTIYTSIKRVTAEFAEDFRRGRREERVIYYNEFVPLLYRTKDKHQIAKVKNKYTGLKTFAI